MYLVQDSEWVNNQPRQLQSDSFPDSPKIMTQIYGNQAFFDKKGLAMPFINAQTELLKCVKDICNPKMF